ncbi:MAG: DUF177 domain-containing protein [Acidobacteriia bacterium]|nr:DUF177 domain-containing protein [Terriglobia bacterium]
MFFNVKELEIKKVVFETAFPPGEIDFSDVGLSQATALEASGSAELLANTLGEIRIRGRLNVRMRADCDRCLEPAEFPVDSDFDLFYRPASQVRGEEEEVEIDAGETEIAFYEGDGIELKDVLREFVVLAMPMQRTCRPDCHGICPVCGQNRNLAQCGCELKPADDRWAALKKLQVKGL